MILKKIKSLTDNFNSRLFHSFIPHQKVISSWQYNYVLGNILLEKNFFCLANFFAYFHIYLKSLKTTNDSMFRILDISFVMLMQIELSIC